MAQSVDIVEHLKSYFLQFQIELEGCPAAFSVATPSAKALETWPNFPVAATPERGRTANGRGLTAVDCAASCLGEAAELVSCCAWGDESLIHANRRSLGKDAIAPDRLVGLTEAQARHRNQWNAQAGTFDWWPASVSPDRTIDWIQANEEFTDRKILLPADAVLIGRREAGDENAVAIADSNGCASGRDLVQAQTAAILELIERDALARWWYGQRHRPVIDLRGLRTLSSIIQYLLDRPRQCILFDVTSDLEIPVFVAVSAEPEGIDIALGSAADIEPEKGALAALTEMLQMEISLNLSREKRHQFWNWETWRQTVDFSTPPISMNSDQKSLNRPLHQYRESHNILDFILESCHRVGISLYYIDMTRSQIGVPTIRVLSPDLCHYKPRFNRKRLLEGDAQDLERSNLRQCALNPKILLV